MNWKDLCEAGISVNTPQKFSQNKNVSTDTLDKVCEYLNVQPGDIMEWVDEKEEERAKIQAQIDALQKKLNNM
jgi:DNA-binding Xre family transcriptional regulator